MPLARHIDAIIALVESARGDTSHRGWTIKANLLDGQRTDASEVARLIAQIHSRILLLTQAEELRACAHLERQNNICYFGMFSVNPDNQDNGIWRQVLAEGERIARQEWGCREMQICNYSARRTDRVVRTAWLSPHRYL